MTNILIYRTDRIGDLIYTCPTIFTIKESFENPKISLITSDKNYDFAKKLGIFNEIINFPQNNLLKKISFLYNMSKKKFDYIFVLDGKERSILSAYLVKSKNKVAISYKNIFIYKFSNIKFVKDNEEKQLNVTFQEVLNLAGINYKLTNYNFLNKKKDNKFSLNIPLKSYIHIHIDEKWFNTLYIKSYTDINPNFIDFTNFLEKISEKKDILVTTGLQSFDLIKKLKDNYFTKTIDNISSKKNQLNSIYLVLEPSFDDLESLLRNANTLISCHGAVTHAANSLNVKIIDIYEESRKAFYYKYTSYMKNHYPLYRTNFNELKNKIYKQVLNSTN